MGGVTAKTIGGQTISDDKIKEIIKEQISSFKKEEKFKVNDTSLKPIEDEIKWLRWELGDIQLDGIKK